FLIASASPQNSVFGTLGNLRGPHETAEILLVRLQNGTVLTGHITQKGSGGEPEQVEAVSGDDLARSVVHAASPEGSLTARDHHGNEVLAVYQPFGDSGWQLVAKLDRKEALAPARQLAKSITAVLLIALLAVIAMLVLLWLQQRRIYQLAVVAKETEALRQLREQEVSYRQMFDSNPHPMWIDDRSSLAFLAFNEAAIAKYGYSRDEFLSMTARDILPPEEIARLEDLMPKADDDPALEALLRHNALWRHRKKDGTEIMVEVSSNPLQFEGRDANLVLAYDVTERERSRARIQESERFAFATIDSMPGHISVLDETGTIIATNSRWRDFGLEQGARLRDVDRGANYLEVCRHAAGGEDDSDAKAVLAGLMAVITGEKQHFRHEYPCFTPSENLWFAVHFTRFPDDGEVRVVAFHEDITARRLAEDDLRELNHYYSALSAINSAIIRIRDPEVMIDEVCNTVCTHTELMLVTARRLEGRMLKGTGAVYGRGAEFVDEPVNEYGEVDVEHSLLPCAQAIREQRAIVINDFTDHELATLWESADERHGIKAALICPVIRRDGAWGILEFYAGQSGFFKAELVRLIQEITADLAYGLDMIEVEERRRDMEAELLLNAEIIASSHEGMFITDQDNRFTMVNPSLCAITGYERSELLGKTPRILSSGHHDRDFYQELWGTLLRTDRWEGEVWDRRKDGEVFPVWLSITRAQESATGAYHHIAIYRDITERKQHENYVEHIATHDILTDLPNRAVLQERLELMLAQAARAGNQLALLFVDLDHFKLINDTLGHGIGDQLLKMIGARISKRLRESDSVCRIGGDEFVVLLSDIQSRENVGVVAEKILHEISQPCLVDEHSLVVTASIGIAIYPQHGNTVTGLMHIADVAMLAAKRSGQDRYHFYSGELGEDAGEHLAMLNALRAAVQNEELFLAYQPQIDLQSGRLVGHEALARWEHPEYGLVPPVRFIPIAEDSGLIIPLGDWIMKEACRQNQQWRERGLADVPVSVNVSVLQFRQDNFVQRVQAVLAETGLPPDRLELEVTESLLIVSTEQSLKKVAELQKIGLKVAIDDFGTGYSSMAYLRQLSPNRLKIDKSFVDDVPHQSDAVAIVRAIVSLAAAVGIETIAEGVETEEQADFLQSLWCAQGQGYLYSKPVPASEFESWLDSWQSRH
ncbi:MAG: EAL domain-containing protein, partial [Haliea sp.]